MYATKYILLTILFCVGVNVRGADAIQEFLNKQKAHQSFRLPQELVGRVTNPLSCSICMDSLTEGTLYKLPKVGLNCGHVFHHKCLDEWVREHLTCPMDREKSKRE